MKEPRRSGERLRLPTETIHHYEAGAESGRLESAGGLLELYRTKEIIARYLPKNRADILDIGGGPGVYSKWLAELGHHVHLIDAVPSHVKQARALARNGSRELFDAQQGDARHIDWPSNSVDIALMLGPLYHLTKKQDRIRALKEAHRVLRPGGLLIAAAISRYASLVDGLRHQFMDDPIFRMILRRDLKEGQHRNPLGKKYYFTTSFFHRPDELAEEVAASGFALRKIYAVEGPAVILRTRELNERLRNKVARRRLMSFIAAVETEPTLLGISSHILAVATA